MTISRRQLFTGAGCAAAAFTLGDNSLGALDINTLASTLVLDHCTTGRLDGTTLADSTPPSNTFEALNWVNATVMWNTGGYADGANPIVLSNGDWLSTLTINENPEGTGELQHTIILRSIDHGATWQQTGVMEPPEAPEASWGTPWVNQTTGRLFVLYTYNIDNIREIPNNNGSLPQHHRVDSVGVIGYRSSNDGGLTWSDRRHLDLPASDIDLRNPWHGDVRMFWMGPGPPKQQGNAAYIGITKMGTVIATHIYDDTEAFIVKMWETSPGVLTASISASIRSGYPNTEEPCPIPFDDGIINTTFRTAVGKLGEAWSTDDGASWTVDWAQDRYGAIVPQPRALAHQFILPDGRMFLWGHNNADGTPTGPRNPAFYRIGERVGPRIIWGAPRLLLWDNDPATRISGPCFIFDGDQMIVAATDKKSARLLRYPLTGL